MKVGGAHYYAPGETKFLYNTPLDINYIAAFSTKHMHPGPFSMQQSLASSHKVKHLWIREHQVPKFNNISLLFYRNNSILFLKYGWWLTSEMARGLSWLWTFQLHLQRRLQTLRGTLHMRTKRQSDTLQSHNYRLICFYNNANVKLSQQHLKYEILYLNKYSVYHFHPAASRDLRCLYQRPPLPTRPETE